MNPVKDFFDTMAPKWDERATDDLEYVRSLLSRVDIPSGGSILDLACGTGVISGLLQRLYSAHVTGMDLSPKMIEIAKKKYAGNDGVTFVCGDFMELEGGAYDFIVLYNAYPHFLEPERLSLALSTHLTPNGGFVILHSLGRDQLRSHHEPLGPHLSRDLDAPEVESRFFQREFEVVKAEEGACFFLIYGRKRQVF